jgi:hypothetical protein
MILPQRMLSVARAARHHRCSSPAIGQLVVSTKSKNDCQDRFVQAVVAQPRHKHEEREGKNTSVVRRAAPLDRGLLEHLALTLRLSRDPTTGSNNANLCLRLAVVGRAEHTRPCKVKARVSRHATQICHTGSARARDYVGPRLNVPVIPGMTTPFFVLFLANFCQLCCLLACSAALTC